MGSEPEWGFGGEAPKKKSNAKEAVANTALLVAGFLLFLVYGIYKLVDPSAHIGESGISILLNVIGFIGLVTIIVGLVRIRAYNRRKTRGY